MLDGPIEEHPSPSPLAPAGGRPEENSEPTPKPFEEIWTQTKKLTRFWRTRRAVVSGEQIFDYTSSELELKNLMGPWTFNAMQSTAAAFVATAIGKVLLFFYPAQENPGVTHAQGFARLYAYAEPISDKIQGWLSSGIAPFTLLVVANLVAWASMWKDDLTPAKKRRAAKAYLYFDAAYGFYPQVFLAVMFNIRTKIEPLACLIHQSCERCDQGVGG